MNYYNSIAKSYNELHGEEQSDKLRIIKDNIKISKSTKILDIGCGTGISSDFECFVIGIDPSTELLKLNKNGIKVLGTAENIPFKDNSFDCVISVTAMHNFNNIENSIKEMERVGKKNFVFSVLKKSKKFNLIKEMIAKTFVVEKAIEEEKDALFFCRKP